MTDYGSNFVMSARQFQHYYFILLPYTVMSYLFHSLLRPFQELPRVCKSQDAACCTFKHLLCGLNLVLDSKSLS